MNKDELKMDFDLDLSKYSYDSEDKPSFTLDEILGITSEVEEAEINGGVADLNENSAEATDEISVTEIHISDKRSKSAENQLDFPVDEAQVENELELTVNQNEAINEDRSESKAEINVTSDPKQSINKVSKVGKKSNAAPTFVNTAAFDQIKAKDKNNDVSNEENKVEGPQMQKEKTIQKKQQPEVVEECTVVEEREDVLYDLKRLRRKITAKAVTVFLFLLCSVYFTMCRISYLRFLLPTELDPSANPRYYNILLLALTAASFLLNISPLFDGLKKMFTARLTADGIAFYFGVACILYDVYFVLNPEKFLPLMINFDFLFILMLLMNLMGKRLLVKHIYLNFEMISQDCHKSVVSGPYGLAIDNDIMIETGNGGDILYASKTKMVADYMRKAFSEQNENRKTDVFYFVVFALLTCVSVLLWLYKAMSLDKMVILLMATCGICAPIFTTWTHTLSVFRLGKYLRKNRTMISGREGASTLLDCGVLVVRDADLLSNSDITLRAMNVRDNYSTNEMLSYLVALFSRVGGPLSGFFDKMIADDYDGMVSDIQGICYHEQLGYTFSCGEKQLIIGTDEFMRQCKIDCPINPLVSRSERIYIAVDGELAGVFSLTYRLSQKAARALQLLEDEGVSVAIVSTDFNLRETMFNGAVYDPDMITILSDETAKGCMSLCADSQISPAEIVTYDNISGMALGLTACNILLLFCQKHSVYRITASLFGILIIAFLGCLLPVPSFWLPFQIFVYQLIWNLPNFLRGIKPKI